jgi:signal transduction histidine kinase
LGWVSPIVSFALVAAQFTVRLPAAAVATVVIPAAFVTGVAASPGLTVADGLFAAGGGWMVVEAVLARLLWRLLRRGGAEADRLLQARFAAERAAATAAARRADQRAHWATVHDTSATTLLMIGLGEVAGTEEWLPCLVRRDMALLAGTPLAGGDGAGVTDLCTGLRAAAERARVRVGMDCPAGTTAPPAVVTALVGATAEALENVRRHAGTGTARFVLRRGPVSTAGEVGSVEVTVADNGPGFEPAAVGPHRFGLAWSVHDRMQAVGGLATVESAPGRGTVVRLRWPA